MVMHACMHACMVNLILILMDEIFQNLTTSAKIDNNSDPSVWSPSYPSCGPKSINIIFYVT
jgi:hypothetical protein